MRRPMVESSLGVPLSQVPGSPIVVTPLHILSSGRDIPFQSYEGFEFQGDDTLPPHRFDTRQGLTIQDSPKEWALDAFKLGGDLSEAMR